MQKGSGMKLDYETRRVLREMIDQASRARVKRVSWFVEARAYTPQNHASHERAMRRKWATQGLVLNERRGELTCNVCGKVSVRRRGGRASRHEVGCKYYESYAERRRDGNGQWGREDTIES